jgi:hypothetical protein
VFCCSPPEVAEPLIDPTPEAIDAEIEGLLIGPKEIL